MAYKRDPKEIVACIDSLVAVVIGILLAPLGVSLAPIDRVLVASSDSMCKVASLEPLAFVTWMSIVFLQAAIIASQIVKAKYIKPSLNPPFKVKACSYAALVFIVLAHILSMIVVIMSLEVKIQKFMCFPMMMRLTFVITIFSVISGYLYVLYVSLGEAPDDAVDAAPAVRPVVHHVASSIPPLSAYPTAHPVATPSLLMSLPPPLLSQLPPLLPATRTTAPIPAPLVASHAASPSARSIASSC